MADYTKYTRDSLIDRIHQLETQIKLKDEAIGDLAPHLPPDSPTAKNKTPAIAAALSTIPEQLSANKRKKQRRRENQRTGFNPTVHATRFIALKIAYLGKNYAGFEGTGSETKGSVEEKLWSALVRACLINPTGDPHVMDWWCCEYSKCGRTDAGVSAFGQVVALKVKSNRRLRRDKKRRKSGGESGTTPVGVDDGKVDAVVEAEMVPDEPLDTTPPAPADEIQYCRILNRLLPPDIRVYAWCPDPPSDFSARFSCRERQYRYFFTQPAFSPIPISLETPKVLAGEAVRSGWLDIDRMRQGAKLFEGLQDFRNFCKVDATKLIANFTRRIYEADIVEVEDANTVLPYLSDEQIKATATIVDGGHPKVYYILIRGSAFLYHQIRHIASVLFMVGQGLEPPSVITSLLDVEKHPQKPTYGMADETPLVLWDCVFRREYVPEDGSDADMLDWVYAGENDTYDFYGAQGMVSELWSVWRKAKMDEVLASRLLDHVTTVARKSKKQSTEHFEEKSSNSETQVSGNKPPELYSRSTRTYEGGSGPNLIGTYIPLLDPKRGLHPLPETTCDKYAQRKGYISAADMRASAAALADERRAKRLNTDKVESVRVEDDEIIGQDHLEE